ncbi:TetR family transcriptional regulator [Flavonifractor sp. An92]|uniref:TetR/AcrR family transcriptional regulator n=1 Tax=Flavonifractor sp. An92 TaxID=1965666 RepID=UPI000B36ED01|nr:MULTISPECIES: TetR/AcrR family transcriptional regulator [unclassified Flavonifractor]OUN06846.1 TetR family transcriptional regulator [Flavonifractor sp. An92]OUQ26071.1 TetR family transcriptional regulator [Flavonifractor sp. An135]
MEYQQRRKEQARQTEQAILQAAMDLSRQKAFDKVSVRDICQKAGITTGAFYHHFKSKDEMLLRGFAPLDRYMEEALAGHESDPPLERLWLLLTTYANFMESLGWELVTRYYQQRLGTPPSHSIDPHRFTYRSMVECLRQCEDQGRLPAGYSPEWMADFLFRHFRGVVIDWIVHQGSYPLLSKLEQDYILFSHIFQKA